MIIHQPHQLRLDGSFVSKSESVQQDNGTFDTQITLLAEGQEHSFIANTEAAWEKEIFPNQRVMFSATLDSYTNKGVRISNVKWNYPDVC